MRFLANENYPFPSVKILREEGFDVRAISESDYGISDPEVIKIAVEQELVILTFDRDYGEIIFRYGLPNPPAVVYYRLKGNEPTEAAKLLLELLKTSSIQLKGRFTVIEETGVRQRLY